MALESLFIRVTNTTAGTILLDDVDFGLGREGAYRVRRPGPVYVPANASVELAFSSDVLLSYESGALRQQLDAGNLTVSTVGGGVQVLTWTYDFAVHGGAVGAITLTDLQSSAKILPPCLLLRGWVEIVTAATSAGAPTLTIGTTAAAAGFLASVNPTTLAANTVNPLDSTLVHNGTDLVAPVRSKNLAVTNVTATIGVAALTAGKFNLHLEILPAFA